MLRVIGAQAIPAVLVVVAALLAAPVVRAVTTSMTLMADRTWPFSLERPRDTDRAVVVASRGRGG